MEFEYEEQKTLRFFTVIKISVLVSEYSEGGGGTFL
jgi:hypothetical protein